MPQLPSLLKYMDCTYQYNSYTKMVVGLAGGATVPRLPARLHTVC